MRTLEHPEPDELRLETVLAALADPVRLTIVRQLASGCEDQACIAFELPVTKSTTTHHFRVLREAGIITQHYRGTAILNNLSGKRFNDRFPGLLEAILGADA